MSGAGASPAFAHAPALMPYDLWTAWAWEPGVVLGLAFATWLYGRGLRILWRASAHGRTIFYWRGLAGAAGWLALWLALISPLHALGGALFSAHMVQHELLMLVAAPLLVLGRPFIVCLWALPLRWRLALGGSALLGSVRRPWRMLSRPAVAWLVHAVVLWSWHAPGLVQASLASQTVHIFQHLSLLGSAVLFWWALIQGRDQRMGYGAAVLYVFTTSVHTSVLGALLTFAPSPWYTAYAESTGPWGLTSLEDQQLAGLIMWVPGGLIYLAAGLALFATWLGKAEARVSPRGGWTLSQRWPVDNVGQSALMCGLVALLIGLTACDADLRREAAELTGGDPGRGRIAIRQHGCPSCHTIPGIQGANGLVGPPLAGIASRVYIAGMLPNTPENMVRWIQAPQEVNRHTAMPNMGVTESEARDIAGYLYTLQ